jgi:hypothetical protein
MAMRNPTRTDQAILPEPLRLRLRVPGNEGCSSPLKTLPPSADTEYMRKITSLIAAMVVILAGSAFASLDTDLDSNTAFYAGEDYNYVIEPPRHFKMISREAVDDGYSFAFIPEKDSYDSSNIKIGVNIYKIRGLDFETVVSNDTSSIRGHYGDDIVFHEVDSVFTKSGQPMKTFYINTQKRFIPNVMISYFDGGNELIIFELVISEDALRFVAEDKFVSCIRRARVMERRELGQR